MFGKQHHSFVFKVLIAAIILTIWSCGQRGSPSGGDADRTPPKVVKSWPDSCATNFSGQEVSWKFDEYVTINGLNNEILVSPPIKSQPKIKLLGKKLTLKFDSAFSANTTYSIFLGAGVKDLNEGNPLENNLLVFSTGDVIDSLSLHGEIYDAETMTALNEGMVHLYKSANDSIVAKEIPSYFAKVRNGHFEFSNLAPGEYSIFALKDNNANYKYDLPDEKIAFLNNRVVVSDQASNEELILNAFSSADKKLYITQKKCDFNGRIDLGFSKSISKFKTHVIDHSFKKDWKIEEFNETKDSLIIWSLEMLSMDSIKIAIEYDELKDTLFYDLSKRKSITTQTITLDQNFKGLNNYYQKEFLFTTSQPISSYDNSKIVLKKDSVVVPANISQLDNRLRTFKLNAELKESSIYFLQILPGGFKTIFNEENKDTLYINFSTTANSALGNLKIKYDFTSSPENGILQIYLEDKLLKQTIPSSKTGTLDLKGSKPGNYKMKYIVDVNNDGKWSPGNYWEKKQPEKVYWYSDKINLRANWDLDVEWILKP